MDRRGVQRGLLSLLRLDSLEPMLFPWRRCCADAVAEGDTRIVVDSRPPGPGLRPMTTDGASRLRALSPEGGPHSEPAFAPAESQLRLLTRAQKAGNGGGRGKLAGLLHSPTSLSREARSRAGGRRRVGGRCRIHQCPKLAGSRGCSRSMGDGSDDVRRTWSDPRALPWRIWGRGSGKGVGNAALGVS